LLFSLRKTTAPADFSIGMVIKTQNSDLKY